MAGAAAAAATTLALLQNAKFAYKVKLKMPAGMESKTQNPKPQTLKRAQKKPSQRNAALSSHSRATTNAMASTTTSSGHRQWQTIRKRFKPR